MYIKLKAPLSSRAEFWRIFWESLIAGLALIAGVLVFATVLAVSIVWSDTGF